MHSLHLALALSATVAWGVPIERRQFDDFFGGGGDFSSDIGGGSFDFGGGGETFGGNGNSIVGSDISFDSTVSDPGSSVADNSFVPPPLDPSPVEQEPVVVDVQAPPQEVVVVQPPPDTVPPPETVQSSAGAVVADVSTSLGATDGSLIASVGPSPDPSPASSDITFVAPSESVPAFTAGQANVAAIASVENLDTSAIGSAPADAGVVSTGKSPSCFHPSIPVVRL
jgi:hypothetical protein